MRIPTISLGLFAATACTTTEPHTRKPVEDIARAVCPPPALFEHAVCVCGDLTQVGTLSVTEGPAGVGSIGVNGHTTLVAEADVAGTWYARGGLTATGASIGESLVTPGDVDLVGDAEISGDAIIGGDLWAIGTLGVAGSLQVGGDETIVGDATIARRGRYAGLPDAPPCACDEERSFDVATAVEAARLATGGETSWERLGDATIALTTGSYYVTAAQLVGDTAITVDGNVSVFVEGDLVSVGSAQWQLAPGASLDLFVSGDVTHVGDLLAGDIADSKGFRLYVGGDASTTVGSATFAGSLYAPRASVRYVGDAQLTGAIFAHELTGTGSLAIAYGDPLTVPRSCSQLPGQDTTRPSPASLAPLARSRR